MIEKDSNTETIILNAAKKIFQQKGFDGTRMQEIAEEAKINKALLHYYYRSKDKLFEAVFQDAFTQFIPRVKELLNSNLDIYKKIEIFVETYIDLLKKNPYIPGFVINEINRNPDRLLNLINLQGIDFALLGMQIAHETKRKKIKPIDIRHIMVNIIGMCIFPFIGRPILQNFLFQNNQEEYDKFIEERKKIIPQFVINSLK